MTEAVVLGALGCVAAMFGYLEHRERRRSVAVTKVEAKADEVLAKLATNHGKEPWQYLEMVAEVNQNVKMLRASQDAATSLNAAQFVALSDRVSRLEAREVA